ncbi:MAG: hypothetical protein GXP42_05380, partial [Chloroflexi bacterium]|nr:hypothetical protein [Chloroflexota bacterium]
MFNRIHFQWLQALAVLGLFIGALAPAAAMNAGERDAIIEKRNFAQTQPTPIDPGEWDQEWVSAAVGPGGGIHAVWSDNRDGSYRLRYSFKPAGGTWQGSAPLDPGGTGLQWGVEIAADGRGNLYAIWLDGRGEKFQIYFATRPAGGDWSAGAPISPTAQEQGAHSLAVNRRGQVIASWTVREAGGWNVFAALRSPDGTWGAVEQVTPAADNIYQLSTAIDDWGRASVSWRRRDWGEELTYKVFFATRPADGPWGEPELVCASADSCWSPSIAVDHDGNVHAIWRGRNGVYTAYRPVRGPWSTPVQV